jgi:hypothetical protein
MKQTKPPATKPEPSKSQKQGYANNSRPNRAGRAPEPPAPPPVQFTWQMKMLAGLALVVLVGLVVILAIQPTTKPERRDLEGAVSTALVNTGITPPPTFVPGSDFGVSFVIFGIKDYIPSLPNEAINLVIINRRAKSLYVSNCDGVILQRFLGTDPKDKTQAANMDNWKSVAPGGYAFCGPASGRQGIQIEPGVSADASFKFDKKITRPFTGESWDIPGTYRLLVQYYLTCPDNTLKIDDCIDKGVSESDYFKIVAPTNNGTPVPTLAPTPKP